MCRARSQLDERRERSITLRAEGFIEKVYAGATGQHVKAGEPLFRFYSPQIVQASVEYRLAACAGGQKAMRRAEAAGISAFPKAIIAALAGEGRFARSRSIGRRRWTAC